MGETGVQSQSSPQIWAVVWASDSVERWDGCWQPWRVEAMPLAHMVLASAQVRNTKIVPERDTSSVPGWTKHTSSPLLATCHRVSGQPSQRASRRRVWWDGKGGPCLQRVSISLVTSHELPVPRFFTCMDVLVFPLCHSLFLLPVFIKIPLKLQPLELFALL